MRFLVPFGIVATISIGKLQEQQPGQFSD